MFGLGYYFSLYNTMRQELAFSIVGLFLPFILDRGRTWLKWYIIGVIITSVLFHKGLLVMLVLPIINYAKDKKWLSYKIEIFVVYLKSATYRVSWEYTCKTTKILLLYIFLGHNRNVVNTKFPYPIKRLEVIRRFNQKSMAFNQSLS